MLDELDFKLFQVGLLRTLEGLEECMWLFSFMFLFKLLQYWT